MQHLSEVYITTITENKHYSCYAESFNIDIESTHLDMKEQRTQIIEQSYYKWVIAVLREDYLTQQSLDDYNAETIQYMLENQKDTDSNLDLPAEYFSSINFNNIQFN